MSYIRPLSNPEGLYIYGLDKNKIVISHNVKPPFASPLIISRSGWLQPQEIIIPENTFHMLGVKWDENNWDRGSDSKVSYRYGSIEEGRNEFDWRLKFSYKEQWFCLYEATWRVIVESIKDHEGWNLRKNTR